MFDRFRRSEPVVVEPEVLAKGVDPERLRAQAAAVGAALAEASQQAGVAAARLAEEARVTAQQAREWAGPRWEKALKDSAAAAGPRVERAAERSLPIVETAHDRLVQEILPKVVAAVNAAAAATATGADRARDVTAAKLTELAKIEPEPEPTRSSKRTVVLWTLAGAAAVAGGVAAWNRSRPTTDPWAEEPWEPTPPSDRLKAAAADVRYGVGDAAEAVGEAAGETVARTREATERAAERAREMSEQVREATRKAAPRRRRVEETGATAAGTLGSEDIMSTTGDQGDLTGLGDPSAGGGLEDVTPPTTSVVGTGDEILDSEKIPTDVPDQAGDPRNTAKGAHEI